jgi:hypothetical protein
MNIKKILLTYKEGATFGLDFTPKQFSKGFAVSLTNNSILKWDEKSNRELKKEVEKIREMAKGLNLKKYFLGWWVNKDKGYLDLTIIIKKKDLAMELGKIFGQKAIYDFRNKKVIFI